MDELLAMAVSALGPLLGAAGLRRRADVAPLRTIDFNYVMSAHAREYLRGKALPKNCHGCGAPDWRRDGGLVVRRSAIFGETFALAEDMAVRCRYCRRWNGGTPYEDRP